MDDDTDEPVETDDSHRIMAELLTSTFSVQLTIARLLDIRGVLRLEELLAAVTDQLRQIPSEKKEQTDMMTVFLSMILGAIAQRDGAAISSTPELGSVVRAIEGGESESPSTPARTSPGEEPEG